MNTSYKTLAVGTASALLAAGLIPAAVVASADHTNPVAVAADVDLANTYAPYPYSTETDPHSLFFGLLSEKTQISTAFNADVTDPTNPIVIIDPTDPNYGVAAESIHTITTLFTREVTTSVAAQGVFEAEYDGFWDDRFVISPLGLFDFFGYDISQDHFAFVTLLGDLQIW